MKVEITSQITVELVASMGSDQSVIDAARVSTGTPSDPDRDRGLLDFLLRNRHASPFEHVTATFMVDAPIFVAREWHRHRTQSYNEVSGRYRELSPRFYAPGTERPLVQRGKPGAYFFEAGTERQLDDTWRSMRSVYAHAYSEYQDLLDRGIAKEVARMVLPVATYTQWYATANLRNWLNFLSLRAENHAQQEIQHAAYEIEALLTGVAPITLELWNKHGRNPL